MTAANFPDLPRRPNDGRHTITDISYSRDFIHCDCGWRGPVDDFAEHRKANGRSKGTTGRLR